MHAEQSNNTSRQLVSYSNRDIRTVSLSTLSRPHLPIESPRCGSRGRTVYYHRPMRRVDDTNQTIADDSGRVLTALVAVAKNIVGAVRNHTGRCTRPLLTPLAVSPPSAPSCFFSRKRRKPAYPTSSELFDTDDSIAGPLSRRTQLTPLLPQRCVPLMKRRSKDRKS